MKRDALVVREPDVRSARDWIVGVGAELLRRANAHDAVTSALLDRVNVVAFCAELPDDMVVRLRCFPNVWGLEA